MACQVGERLEYSLNEPSVNGLDRGTEVVVRGYCEAQEVV